MSEMYSLLITELPKIVLIGYIIGWVGFILSMFRPGINPYEPIPMLYTKKELVAIFIIAILWPIVALALVVNNLRGDTFEE